MSVHFEPEWGFRLARNTQDVQIMFRTVFVLFGKTVYWGLGGTRGDWFVGLVLVVVTANRKDIDVICIELVDQPIPLRNAL